MKSIVYILIAVFISSILMQAIPRSAYKQDLTIRIQCENNNSNPDLMVQSGLIIKNRLANYGLDNPEITVFENQNCIDITIKDSYELNEVLPLILSKGKLEFYETFSREEAIKQFKDLESLSELMIFPTTDKELTVLNSSPILGYPEGNNRLMVENYLNSNTLNTNGIKFAWSTFMNKNARYELFLLKEHFNLEGNKVEKSFSRHSEFGETIISISFNSKGAERWQEMTRRNINNSIAFVIDNTVYCAPIVKSEIKNGSCEISGNFSAKEANKLSCLINNGELPLSFMLVQ